MHRRFKSAPPTKMAQDQEVRYPARAAVLFGGALVLFLNIGQAKADLSGAREPGNSGRPVLLFLCVGEDEESRALETGFLEQLELVLLDFEVQKARILGGGFPGRALSEQLDTIRPFAERTGAGIAAWIEQTSSSAISLHLTALSRGRSWVRTVEVAGGPGSEAELAMAVLELLVQEKLSGSGAHGHDVQQPPGFRQRLGLMPFFRVTDGLFGHEGRWLHLGGGVAAEWWPAPRFFVRGQVAVKKGPLDRFADGEVNGMEVEPGVALGCLFRAGRLEWGPQVGMSAPWYNFRLQLGSGDAHSYSWWSVRWSAGFDLRLLLSESIAIAVSVEAGAFPNKEEFYRVSDGSTVLATPFVEWAATVGIVFFVI
jgi:hypothetical protein